jgi:hypothetical protein
LTRPSDTFGDFESLTVLAKQDIVAAFDTHLLVLPVQLDSLHTSLVIRALAALSGLRVFVKRPFGAVERFVDVV